MSQGRNAIRNDQSLAWNSLKQLKNDFLLYGKFNVAKLQDIVQIVNGIRNRTLSLEKLLTGQDAAYTCNMLIWHLICQE